MEEEKYDLKSIEECIEVIKRYNTKNKGTDKIGTANTSQQLDASSSRKESMSFSDHLFEFDDGHAEWLKALQNIYFRSSIQGESSESLLVEDGNLHLSFDLDDEKSRELMVTLSKVTLPEIYTLKIMNFYESDEDLENFLNNCLSSVCNFIFISESFWVDIHDYLTNILKISWLKNLYLKGFMIDGEDWERIFSSVNIQWITFESWNLGIDEEFTINLSSDSNSKILLPILNKICLIDNEIDKETMTLLLKEIKKSPIKDSLKTIELKDWELSVTDVTNVIKRLGLSIIVQ